MSNYAEKLRDPRWQKLRLKKLEAADWKCERCGCCSATLEVHHKEYVPGREPWDYDLTELCSLCSTCHSREHDKRPPSPTRLAELEAIARAETLRLQAAGKAPRTPIEAEIESVTEQIPMAEKSGDKLWLSQLMGRALELNRRRLGIRADGA